MKLTKAPSSCLIFYFQTFSGCNFVREADGIRILWEFQKNSKAIRLLQYFLLNIFLTILGADGFSFYFHEICICLIFLNAHKWKQRWSFRKDFNLLWITNRTIILFCSFHLIFLSSPPWTVSKYCKTKFYHYLPFVRTRTALHFKNNSPDFINRISVSISCDKFSLQKYL